MSIRANVGIIVLNDWFKRWSFWTIKRDQSSQKFETSWKIIWIKVHFEMIKENYKWENV